MGVKNLWDILDSCKKKLPLHHLQNKKVCVDLSCWLVQLHTAYRSPAFAREKVYLKNLFHRVRALIALNCSLIFVTDGAIPSIKLSTYRRRLGSSSAAAREEANSQQMLSLRRNMGSEFSCMIKEAKLLGMALGIPCIDSMEEAEAQCALLNSASLCDGCFTSDSDIFLFGARTVYRDVFIGEGGYVICYEMADIEKKLGFGRNSLISLALLLGSDYSNGVRGFRPETACQFVKSVGDDSVLNQMLSGGVKATRRHKGKNIGSEDSKVEDICLNTNTIEARPSHDSDGQFLKVISAYLEPKCHSPDSEVVQRVCSQHPFLRSQLQQICEQYFDWSPEKTDQYILPKIAERELRRFANLCSTSSDLGLRSSLNEIPVPCPVSAIVKLRKVQGSEYYEVSWRNVDLQVSIVPGDLLRRACPEKINEFLEKRQEKKKQKRKARPKKSAQSAVKEVDLQLQELLLGIESESHNLLATANCSDTADVHSGAPGKDIVDLSSPSPPLRACKLAKSQMFIRSMALTGNEIDPLSESLLPSVESQSSTLSDDVQNVGPDSDPIDLSSPLPSIAHKPASRSNISVGLRGLLLAEGAERSALSDISNFPAGDRMLVAAPGKHKAGADDNDLQTKGSTFSNETRNRSLSGLTGCSQRSSDVLNVAVETDTVDLSSSSPAIGDCKLVDLSSPSPAIGDCKLVKHGEKANQSADVIDIGESDSDASPRHERKARELRLFLDSIRGDLY